jgi:hypothetical protein
MTTETAAGRVAMPMQLDHSRPDPKRSHLRFTQQRNDMSHEPLHSLIDRWTSDVQFRADVRVDPLAAIARAGIALSPDEQAAVQAVDWSLSDDELTARASHFPV